MAVTTTSRFGITRWSAGTDLFTRAHMDGSHAAIEQRGAIYLQGTAAARPSAGTIGRFYYATDTAVFTYDDGVAWVNVSSPDTVTLTATQTLTNKTLTSPVINGTVTGTAAFTGVTGIASPEYVQYDLTHSQTIAVGKTYWNDLEGTVDLGLKGGNVTLHTGQQVVARVRNDTGSQLLKGRAVYVSGANGDRKQVSYAQADSENTSSKTIGVLMENIATGAEGFISVIGLVRGLDTSGFTVGSAVWLSPTVAGGLTATRPVTPNHAVFIGWVTRVHANNGEIYINVQNGYELEELHGVLLTSPVNKDVLFYDGSKWINKSLSSALDGITFTGTVALPATTSIGNVSATEISYLDGVESPIQDQIDGAGFISSFMMAGL
jgi:hypothetical protein